LPWLAIELIPKLSGTIQTATSGGLVKLLLILALSLSLSQPSTVQAQETSKKEVGMSAPAFHARDQFGKDQSLSSLMGPKGLVILFFRSADW
jgi:hypothetical protein